jgi:hypothetical protein
MIWIFSAFALVLVAGAILSILSIKWKRRIDAADNLVMEVWILTQNYKYVGCEEYVARLNKAVKEYREEFA